MINVNNQLMSEFEACATINIDWDRIQGREIFITGATGLVCTYILSVLFERNRQTLGSPIKIIVVGRDKRKFEDRYADIFNAYPEQKQNVSFIEHDLNQPFNIDINSDYVIHLASNTHPRLYAVDPIGTEMTNILGTYNLLNAMKNPNARFFFCSSGDVYGDNRSDKLLIDEDDCGYINCNTLRAGYIEGKRASEALCQAYRESKGLDFVTGRLCRIYGPTIQLEDSKAITQFIKNAVNGENIVLKSAGTQTFSYLYIYDVITAILTILTAGKEGNAYNVADKAQSCSLKNLAEILANTAGTKVVFDLPDKTEAKGASSFQSVILNSDKLESLGWKSKYDMMTGLTITVKALKER